jgi:dihydrofolate synthase/folylpolyglutamate synthase
MAVGAPLLRTGPRQPYRAVLRAAGWDGIVIDVRTPRQTFRELRLGLLGGHQAQNAAVALAMLDALRLDGERRGRSLAAVGEAAIRAGLAATRWPGRLELLESTSYGRILLDGAHNPAGAAALAAALGELGVRRPVIVLGAMRGKRIHGVLRALAGLDPRFVFTRVADPGALPPDVLAGAWRRVRTAGRRPLVAPDPRAALERAADLRAGEDPIVVAGSLYLVGAVRGMIVGE